VVILVIDLELVTGDHALAKSAPPKSAVLTPREFADLLPT
jgi:hypothetical protein